MDTNESAEGSRLRSSEIQPSSGGPGSTSEQFPSSDGRPRTALAAATAAAAAAASAASAAAAARAAALRAQGQAPDSAFTEPSSDSRLQPSFAHKIGHGSPGLEPVRVSYMARDPYTTTDLSSSPGLLTGSSTGPAPGYSHGLITSSSSGPAPVFSSGPGHGSVPGSSSGPGQGSSSGPGQGSVPGSSSGPGQGSVPGSSSGPGHAPGPGSSSGPGHGSVPGPSSGPGHGSVPGSATSPGHVHIATSTSGPSHGFGSGRGSGPASGPGPGSGPGLSSSTSPKFRSLGTDLVPNYASWSHQCHWEPQKQPQWESLRVSEPGSRGPQKPSEVERKSKVFGEALPRGQCLLYNWEEERATNHLDQVPRMQDGSESFFFRHGHQGLLTLQPQSPMPSSTTHKDSYQPPASFRQPLRGKREAMVEMLLRHQICKEVRAEQEPTTRKLLEVESVTHHDYRMELVQAGPPAPTKPHDYRKEQPETFWKQRARQLTGVSNIRTLDTPFRKNCSFSTPVPLSLGQPLPYEPASHPYQSAEMSSLACQGGGRGCEGGRVTPV
ncbi:sperm-associated antigen 8 [Lepus europaeus]|uniref:sperm-associated antigen 8 n=1 Tax=Lepus europaeus TaxID=9983 RepID=UPI002B46C15D|nr:sperm-associated antigen 8 [Lepus europaeus]